MNRFKYVTFDDVKLAQDKLQIVLSTNNKFGALPTTQDYLIPYYLFKFPNRLASKKVLNCENSRFFSLPAAWDL